MPFPRNADFVGRDGDLARLRVTLSGPGPVGIRPAGLTGMGGIGKTQLAVEYVYRHKDDYPDGIFWIDAAGSMAEGFARLASDHRSKWIELDRPRDEQIRSAFAALNQRPEGLLVLDNVPDPAAIAVPLLPDCVPEDLRCRLLFTTRRHDLGRFAGVEVTVLPELPALQLLLRHSSRQAALDPAYPDHEHARAIARMLGRLPLALELAGAYLGKFSSDVSLAGISGGLEICWCAHDPGRRRRRIDRGRPEEGSRTSSCGHDRRAMGGAPGRVRPAATPGREPVRGISRSADRALVHAVGIGR